jgi:hypothetical protein
MALKNPLSGMPIPLGIIPQMIAANRSDAKAKKRKNPVEAAMEGVPTGMAKGGKVGRGDGCCMKGKTKGAMR